MNKDIRIKISPESIGIVDEEKEREFLENFYFDEIPGKLFEVDNACVSSIDKNHINVVVVLTDGSMMSYFASVNKRDERFVRVEIEDASGEAIFAEKAKSNEELGMSEFETISESVIAFGLTHLLQ